MAEMVDDNFILIQTSHGSWYEIDPATSIGTRYIPRNAAQRDQDAGKMCSNVLPALREDVESVGSQIAQEPDHYRISGSGHFYCVGKASDAPKVAFARRTQDQHRGKGFKWGTNEVGDGLYRLSWKGHSLDDAIDILAVSAIREDLDSTIGCHMIDWPQNIDYVHPGDDIVFIGRGRIMRMD